MTLKCRIPTSAYLRPNVRLSVTSYLTKMLIHIDMFHIFPPPLMMSYFGKIPSPSPYTGSLELRRAKHQATKVEVVVPSSLPIYNSPWTWENSEFSSLSGLLDLEVRVVVCSFSPLILYLRQRLQLCW